MRRPTIPFLSIALGALALLVLTSAPLATAEEEGAGAAAEIVDTCAGCHDLETPGYTRNPHRVINQDPQLAAHLGVESSCTGCHGDASTHMDEGGGEGTIFAFGPEETAVVKSDRCLTCHDDAHPRFFATSHAAAGLSCTDCHDIHGDDAGNNLLATADDEFAEFSDFAGTVTASCATCHQDTLVNFEFNERHRLQEGILDCASCHNPHEPQSRMMLGGFKQEMCIDCHTDKGGPFVFEHGSSRVEGCVACHEPHGNANRHMLTFQSVADLCFSCHVVVPGFHTRFTNESVCTNCHSTIHGSNFDPAFLK